MGAMCGHCGSKAVSKELCSHGFRWCKKCGGHLELPFEKECGSK